MLRRLLQSARDLVAPIMNVEKVQCVPLPGLVRVVLHDASGFRTVRLNMAPEHAAIVGRDLTLAGAHAAAAEGSDES